MPPWIPLKPETRAQDDVRSVLEEEIRHLLLIPVLLGLVLLPPVDHHGDQVVFCMRLAKIYDLLLNKAVRKGRTQEEVNTVIHRRGAGVGFGLGGDEVPERVTDEAPPPVGKRPGFHGLGYVGVAAQDDVRSVLRC